MRINHLYPLVNFTAINRVESLFTELEKPVNQNKYTFNQLKKDLLHQELILLNDLKQNPAIFEEVKEFYQALKEDKKWNQFIRRV